MCVCVYVCSVYAVDLWVRVEDLLEEVALNFLEGNDRTVDYRTVMYCTVALNSRLGTYTLYSIQV